MKEPIWAHPEAVRLAHQEQLAEHGGGTGIHDANLLASALDRPQNLFHYAEEPVSLFALAAAYAFGISKNHPFVDGNKRTALTVCLGFLHQNGIHVLADQVETFKIFYGLAAGSLSEEELALWLEQHQQ